MDSNDNKVAPNRSESKITKNFEQKMQNRSALSVAASDSSSTTNHNNENLQNSRVIKQIFTLDAKKLKSLGIESNILSAITKLNGKKGVAATVATAAAAADKQEKNATPALPQIVDTTNRTSSELAKVPLSVPATIKLPTNEAKDATVSSVADKKVHVLSDVVLNELDLDQLSATVATKPIKNAKDILIGAKSTSPSFTRPSTSRVELPLRKIAATKCHDIPMDATISLNLSSDDSSDDFAGFFPSIEEMARKQLEELNALTLRTPLKKVIPVDSQSDSHGEDIVTSQIDEAPDTKDDVSSSESVSSDAVSDLSIGELIYTARLAIENDEKSKSAAGRTSQASNDEQGSSQFSSEQIDKDTFIDDFLSSMKNNFSINSHTIDDDEDSQQNQDVERPASSSSSESDDEMCAESVSKDVCAKKSVCSSPATIETIGSDVELAIESPVTAEPQNEIEIESQQIDETMKSEAVPLESETDELIEAVVMNTNETPEEGISIEEEKSSVQVTENIPDTKSTLNSFPITEETPSDAYATPKPKEVVKKRRGRMPKHRKLVNDSLTEDADDTTVSEPKDAKPEVIDTSRTVSRSGRRRKQKMIEDFFYAPKSKQSSVEHSHEAVEPPKSENKKEIVPDLVAQIVEPTKPAEPTEPMEPTKSTKSTKPTAPTKPTPGRRGRKRKIEETVESDIVSVVETPSVKTPSVETPPVETTPDPVVPRKRGRPSKKSISATITTPTLPAETSTTPSPTLHQMKLNLSAESELPNKTENDIAEVAQPRRRGRKKAIAPQEENSADVENSIVVEETPIEPKRARKKPAKAAAVVQTPNTFTCGNCQEVVPSARWKKHESSHYGVAWRDGIDAALDLSDEALLAREMTKFVKRTKTSYLVCAKCGDRRRSVVGYISHLQVCGLTEEELANARVKCEHCGKTYRKVSLPIHIQGFCPVLRIKKQQEEATLRAAAEPEQANEEEEKLDSKRRSRFGRRKKKRRFYDGSATSGPMRIEDFVKRNDRITGGTFIGWRRTLRENNIIKCLSDNCPFVSTSTEEMHQHYKACTPKFRCAFCSYFGAERDSVVAHIRTEHADEMRTLSGGKKKRDSGDENGEEDGDNDDDDDFHASDESSSSDGYYESGDESSDMSSNDGTDGECDDRRLRLKVRPNKKIVSMVYQMETFAPKLWRMVRTHYQEALYLGDQYYPQAMSWTQRFVADNYDRDGLAIGERGGSVRVLRDSRKYLQSLHSQSAPFKNAATDAYKLRDAQPLGTENDAQPLNAENEAEKQRLPLFGCASEVGDMKPSVLFCGGPVVAIEWVPFPADYAGPQVLVVCSRRPNGKYTLLRGKLERSEYLIQLWRVTMKTKTEIEQCEFMYGIACDDGPILCMKLCPSDAFVDGSQLALLAVPSHNGNINIISLPFDVQGAKRPKLVAVKPKIVLQLGEAYETAVSQLTWSREHGHTTICAGYTSGMVAVWNLRNLNSTYLCKRHDDGSRSLQPQRIFQPTQKCITMLELHGDHANVPRWLLVGGFDRNVYFYDLNDPFATKISTTSFKSRLTTGTWPMHWPNYICLYDSAMGFNGASAHIKFVHDRFNWNPMRSHGFEGTSSNLAFNDWLNCCIFGNDSGDLFFIRFQQFLLYDRLDSSSDMKIIGMTDVDVASESQRSIVFNDIVPSVDASKYEQSRQPTIEEMPPTKVNRIAFNANESHHKMYAVGYEMGFCRINFLP